MTSRLTIIIVTHNSAAVIGACLSAIDPQLPVILVDNASHDDTITIAASHPHISILPCTENLGFGRANNLALETVTTEFALLLNPDAILKPSCCDALLRAADIYQQAAIIAPLLMTSDGSLEDNYKNAIFTRHGIKTIHQPPEGDLCADYLSGAVMLLRMQPLATLGFFDPGIFMFYEDDDICLRVRAAGYELVVAKEAVAIHTRGHSSPSTFRYLFRKNWHMNWSRLYLERKYHGKHKAMKLALGQLLTYSGKTLGYALLLRKGKGLKSFGRLCGTVAFMIA